MIVHNVFDRLVAQLVGLERDLRVRVSVAHTRVGSLLRLPHVASVALSILQSLLEVICWQHRIVGDVVLVGTIKLSLFLSETSLHPIVRIQVSLPRRRHTSHILI